MRILLDTNILAHAHNKSSPYQDEAGKILVGALKGELEAFVSPQVIYELYAVITDQRRVEYPLSPGEAAELCVDLWESKDLGKLNLTPLMTRDALLLAGELGLRGGEVFDCVLAVTARENDVYEIYTQNTRDFAKYPFLKVVNPLGD